MATTRYQYSGTIVDEKKNTRRMSLFPTIKADDITSPDDIIVELKVTDRFDKLANDYLGDGRLWWVLCLINDVSTPFSLLPGSLIRIPTNISKVMNAIQRKAYEK